MPERNILVSNFQKSPSTEG